jgi:hypothetical protein
MRADYKCIKCDKIIEYVKPYGEEFPKQITNQSECSSNSECVFERTYNSVPVIDVALGLTGNASTGYMGENVYKQSPYSPNRINDYPTRHKYLHKEQ